MNTKGKFNSTAFIILSLMMTMLTSCQNKQGDTIHAEHAQEGTIIYTCPMHPEVVSSKSGQCPLCNMDLEPMVDEPLVQIISPNKQVLSNQATVKLQVGSGGETIQSQGFISIDPNRNQSLSARFGGRIEKLYVKYNWQYVKQGEKILELYSPTLRTVQEEHLFLMKTETGNQLLERSREKLRLLGITDNQISKLEKDATVASTVSVYSPSDGYVSFDEQSMSTGQSAENKSGMDGMGAKAEGSTERTSTTAAQIREGAYINEGQILFSTNDLKQVWALVSVANGQLAHIKENQSLDIISESDPTKIRKGKITLIEKTFEASGQRFARARVILPNADQSLKINSIVTAQIEVSENKHWRVPSSAIYKTGLNYYVWVKSGTTKKGTGIFQLRKVMAGASNQGMTSITSGLSPNEEIANEAGFMTDSETFVNVN